MGVSGQQHAPAALYPRGKDPRYPLYRRLGGPQSSNCKVDCIMKIVEMWWIIWTQLMYAYKHMCILTYIHTHTYIHTYVRTYIHTYIHTYVHTQYVSSDVRFAVSWEFNVVYFNVKSRVTPPAPNNITCHHSAQWRSIEFELQEALLLHTMCVRY
jgi:hypothetical protein